MAKIVNTRLNEMNNVTCQALIRNASQYVLNDCIKRCDYLYGPCICECLDPYFEYQVGLAHKYVVIIIGVVLVIFLAMMGCAHMRHNRPSRQVQNLQMHQRQRHIQEQEPANRYAWTLPSYDESQRDLPPKYEDEHPSEMSSGPPRDTDRMHSVT